MHWRRLIYLSIWYRPAISPYEVGGGRSSCWSGSGGSRTLTPPFGGDDVVVLLKGEPPGTPTPTPTNTVPPTVTPTPTDCGYKLNVVDVAASADDGNVPENTLDRDLNTRWSASGDPQWIEFTLAEQATVKCDGVTLGTASGLSCDGLVGFGSRNNACEFDNLYVE